MFWDFLLESNITTNRRKQTIKLTSNLKQILNNILNRNGSYLDREKFYHFETIEIFDHKNLPQKITLNNLWCLIKQKVLKKR